MWHFGSQVENPTEETKLSFKNAKDGVLFLQQLCYKKLSVFGRKVPKEESQNLKSFVRTYIHGQ